MADLIDSLLLVPVQFAIGHGVLFKEVANLVSRRQEVIIPDVIIVSGGESRLKDVMSSPL